MQQTTVLTGQLSTAAGVRAPLARIADQVFVDLAEELESQGVARRVAADMFGMALRGYQKKLRRLTESRSAADPYAVALGARAHPPRAARARPICCSASVTTASARSARS